MLSNARAGEQPEISLHPFLHLKKLLKQHIKDLGGKTRGQNEDKLWVCGQCVCEAA